MAASPQYKIYDSKKVYMASCKDAYDAAILVAAHGAGWFVKWGHSVVVWTEGGDSIARSQLSAGYENRAIVMEQRVREHHAAFYAKINALKGSK